MVMTEHVCCIHAKFYLVVSLIELIAHHHFEYSFEGYIKDFTWSTFIQTVRTYLCIMKILRRNVVFCVLLIWLSLIYIKSKWLFKLFYGIHHLYHETLMFIMSTFFCWLNSNINLQILSPTVGLNISFNFITLGDIMLYANMDLQRIYS